MVLVYQDDEIEETLNDGIGDGAEASVHITDEEEETIVAAAQVIAICPEVLSNVDGFNSAYEEDETMWQYHHEDENVAHESDEDYVSVLDQQPTKRSTRGR
jgi:hypothetical protein